MAKSKSKKNNDNPSAAKRFLAHKWMVLRVTVIAVIVGLVAFFHEVVFEVIGFGLVLWLIWAVVVAVIAWKRNWQTLRRRWNVWPGMLLLTVAIWDILALFSPAFAIGETSFDTASLGGNLGRYLAGTESAGAPPALRITLLMVGGVAFVAPGISLTFVKFMLLLAKGAVTALFSSVSWLFTTLGQQLALLYNKYPLHQFLMGVAAALGQVFRRQRAVESETADIAISVERDVSHGGKEPESATKDIAAPRPAIDIEGREALAASRKGPAPRPTTAEAHLLPPIGILDEISEVEFTEADNMQRARLIEEALASYGVDAKVVQINPGPSVTQFGVEPGWDRKYKRIVERDQQGRVKLDKDGNPIARLEEVSKTRVKVERITALGNNLALALASPSIRIEAPVPGKSLVGIEVPNTSSSVVHIRSVIESSSFEKIKSKSKLSIALGKGAAGEPVAADLAKMPHLLIAGTTGSGKTVCINSIIACLLMYNTPQDVRFLLIDPKRVELVSFDGIPHLISPVVIEVDKAIESLRRVIKEMDNRYRKFSAVGVRNIEGYNSSKLTAEPLPYLVVIVDELADLMMTAAEVVEPSICRLAQLSRATGIHLVIATQRPSVDVVTGLIKANFPTRIAFAVASLVDSRTILDTGGAEKLLGRGDMLYMPPDIAKPKRLRGCFTSDQEIEKLVKFWQQQKEYVLQQQPEDPIAKEFASLKTEELSSDDPMLVAARRLARDSGHISTSFLQRRLHIGYPRAARIMDTLEQEGVISRSEPSGPAEVVDLEVDDFDRVEE
ncbi:MAG TPA: DNA translocase FtsK [Dehalococcoidia bacterium]|nr:DNA translocase FtsK [Dehalococcoidia bacterium]